MTRWTTVVIVLCSYCLAAQTTPIRNQSARNLKLQPILDYISSAWNTLTRSTTSCSGVADAKMAQPSVLYLPADFALPSTLEGLSRCGIRMAQLPLLIHGPGPVRASEMQPPGLLFLPNSYVVPGGRFNEMYGWDSYFIIRGLLREGKIDLARGMVENLFFEIERYGAVLNANRTYYLTRSQPPFLSSMIMEVYEVDKARGTASRSWLARAYEYANRDYEMWISEPHGAGTTGLSRYYDFGEGPVPEGLRDEVGYYQDVLQYFFSQYKHSPYLAEADIKGALPYPQFSLQTCEDKITPPNSKCRSPKYVGLSREYYKGDRSMRESGFDVSFRFGPYGADTHRYAPVCLNSLLYKTETDLEKITTWLGDKNAAVQWHVRAARRKEIIQSLLWNRQRGMFFDYQFESKKLSSYEYATTFDPLWAGIATDSQASAVVENLQLFEHQGGLAMSTRRTGVQWDYPYGWAPMQLLAVEGLRRYGYNDDADRLAYEFLSMVLANFQRDRNIREKYNVVTDSSNIQVAEGYRTNVIGFGWTNGVFLELLNQLPPKWVSRLAALSPR